MEAIVQQLQFLISVIGASGGNAKKYMKPGLIIIVVGVFMIGTNILQSFSNNNHSRI